MEELFTAIVEGLRKIVKDQDLVITKVAKIPATNSEGGIVVDMRDMHKLSYQDVVEELHKIIKMMMPYNNIHLQIWVGKRSISYDIHPPNGATLSTSCKRVKIHIPKQNPQNRILK